MKEMITECKMRSGLACSGCPYGDLCYAIQMMYNSAPTYLNKKEVKSIRKIFPKIIKQFKKASKK